MGVGDRSEIDRLSRDSGRSPTILRRRLSPVEAIRRPQWAGDRDTARQLVPMGLIGAWDSECVEDRKVLERIAGTSYDAVQKDFVGLLGINDCPVWSVGRHRGIASKIDVVFGIANWLTEHDIDELLSVAGGVLGEVDPALDLDERNRWAAVLHGKVRRYSRALRSGVCETLALLAEHGNHIFRRRFGMDLEAKVSALVARLLTPLTDEVLLSQVDDLPQYAEAAPECLLELLEGDLRSDNPVAHCLLAPSTTDAFGSGCPRTGLLWALECLAWNPEHLPRVAMILAKMSEKVIRDNWTNNPINSLAAVFQHWMPQTAANLERRKKVLELVCDRYPRVGWHMCTEQFKSYGFGDYSYRPRWRGDASGAGGVTTRGESREFVRKALDIAIKWPTHTSDTLGDLIAHVARMSPESQARVWSSVEKWAAETTTSDGDRSQLRERVRLYGLSRRARRQASADTRTRAREVYESLVPRSLALRHGWLFKNAWVDESSEELEEEEVDLEARNERIRILRMGALREILDEEGLSGVMLLLHSSGAAAHIGNYVATIFGGDVEALKEVFLCCLREEGSAEAKVGEFIRGFMTAAADDLTLDDLLAIASEVADGNVLRLLLCAPFDATTWDAAERYGPEVAENYWRKVVPFGWHFTASQWRTLVARLLKVGRPLEAFRVCSVSWTETETSVIVDVLRGVAGVREAPEELHLDGYRIGKAFEVLGGRNDIAWEEMAQLEFAFAAILEYEDVGMPNLERHVAESPMFWVQLLALVFKRSDAGEDPEEWRIANPDRHRAMGENAYRVLQWVKRVPGTHTAGEIDADALQRWVVEARRLATECARSDFCDLEMGELLARSAAVTVGDVADGDVWPDRAICEVLELIGSRTVVEGFLIGTVNARGVTVRSAYDGGQQERALADRYTRLSDRIGVEYPFAGQILRELAGTYERDAGRHDDEVELNQRLRS